MTRLRARLIGFLCALQLSGTGMADAAPDHAAVYRKIDEKISASLKEQRFVGLSIAVLWKGNAEFVGHYGTKDAQSAAKPDNNTVYEIGSVSKVLTTLLLVESSIDLESPLSKFIPKGVIAPLPAGHEIRMRDLALHTGFRFSVPCVPKEENPDEMECFGVDPKSNDPYKAVTRRDLFQYVTAYSRMLKWAPKEFFPAPGRFYEYSNAGMGLLGELLAMREKTDYETLLKRKILNGLRMPNTSVKLSCEPGGPSCPNLAKVYFSEKHGEAWKNGTLWHLPGMAGAGGVHSTLSDMKRFLAAEMGHEDYFDSKFFQTSLGRAILKSQINLPDAEKKIAENICAPEDPPTKPCNKSKMTMVPAMAAMDKLAFFHAGETGSSQSMLMFSQDRKFGVVLLSNSSTRDFHFANAMALCSFELAGLLPSGNCKF